MATMGNQMLYPASQLSASWSRKEGKQALLVAKHLMETRVIIEVVRNFSKLTKKPILRSCYAFMC